MVDVVPEAETLLAVGLLICWARRFRSLIPFRHR
jgi:hypothetical protein